MKKSYHLFIDGTFQNLFFKEFVKDKAITNGVKGFIRFQPDGRAEIFLEGDAKNVSLVIDEVKSNTKHCQIRRIEKKEEKFQDFKQFKVLNF